MIDIESCWDFSDPAASEAKFRALLDGASAEDQAILWTQIARTFSLRNRFEEARDALTHARVESAEAKVRFELESGRIFNSSNEPEKAVGHFEAALNHAEKAGLEYLLLDAIHMLAIADAPNAISWSEKGIALAKNSQEEKCRRWLGPLYNNLGWTRLESGDAAGAIREFELGLAERERQGVPGPIEIAKEALEEARKALGRQK